MLEQTSPHRTPAIDLRSGNERINDENVGRRDGLCGH